nr:hypothetical protein [Tanacetum cinerariifolium]
MAFTASAFVLAIYIQQFWNTLTYDAKTKAYSFQLDETRFTLDANHLTEALEITLIDQAHQFVSPSSGDAIMDMVISWVILRNAPYYNSYMEMVAKQDRKVAAEKDGKKKIEKSTKNTLPQPTDKGKVIKVHKAKSQFQLVDKPGNEPAHSEPKPKLVHQGKGDEDDIELAIWMSLESFPAQSQEHTNGVAIQEPVVEATRPLLVVEGKVTKEASTGPSAPADAETEISATSEKTNSGDETKILQIDEEEKKDVDDQVKLDEKTDELDQGQAGSDPGRTPKSRPPPKQEVMHEDQARPDSRESRGALAGPDPEPIHDEFMADLYPKVHESLKFLMDERVFVWDLISSTLSSMKNLEDAFAIGDQFINEKSTEDEPEKPNVEAKAITMVTILIYQVPLLFMPILVFDLSPTKPASSTTQAPVFTATTATTTTPLPPPLQQ